MDALLVRTALGAALASWALHAAARRYAARHGIAERSAQTFFSLVSHAALAAVGLVAFWNEPCSLSTAANIAARGTGGAPIHVHYGATVGHYLFALYAHLLVDTPRSRTDYWMLVAHHIGTLVVVGASYLDGYMHVGSLVMLLHDPADVFLDAAKLLNALRAERAAKVAFACLVVVWVPTRIVHYWADVIYDIVAMAPPQPKYLALLGLVGTLNLWWSYLIARIVVSAARGDAMRDVREDARDEKTE